MSTHARVALAILLICGVLFLPTWAEIFQRWIMLAETESHGFLVLAASVWMIFSVALSRSEISVSRLGFLSALVLAGATLIWALAFLANVFVIQAALIPITLLIALSSIVGWKSARPYIFPLAYLYFALPVWGWLAAPLQSLSVLAVSGLLTLFGVPVYIEGAEVHLAAGSFVIESGCSGLNFLLVGAALAALYGYLFTRDQRKRLVLICAAVILAVITNWIRITAIIIAGHVSEMQHFLITVDHYYFGWGLFLLMFVPFYLLARRVECASNSSEENAIPDKSEAGSATVWRRKAILAGVVAAVFPTWAYAVQTVAASASVPEIGLPPGFVELPEVYAESDWKPNFPGAATERRAVYQTQTGPIYIYLNAFTVQTNGRELVGHTSSVRGAGVLESGPIRSESLLQPDMVRKQVLVTESLRRGGVREVVVYWYMVGGQSMVDPVRVKFNEVIARFAGRPRSGIVALMMICSQGCDEQRSTLLDFLTEQVHTIEEIAAGPSDRGEG